MALALSRLPTQTVRAAEEPTPRPSASKLKWHTRGAKVVKATAEEPGETSPAASAKSTSAKSTNARPALATEPAAKTPTGKTPSSKASRSRLRDSIMQVNNISADPVNDPFGDEKPAAEGAAKSEGELPAPAEAPAFDAPAPATDAAPTDNVPMPADNEPVPDERFRAPRTDLDDFGVPKKFAREEGLLEDIIVPGDLSCAEQKKECEKIIEVLRTRSNLKEIVVGIVVEGEEGLVAVEGKDYPCECTMPKDKYLGRHWEPTVFTWKATGTCHKPLYFEDVNLERYGHSWNPVVQPFMSAGHFFVSVPLLPYKMGLTPPGECMYTLGYYRPGNCAPYLIDPIPWSVRAGLFQAAGITGFMYIFFPPAG